MILGRGGEGGVLDDEWEVCWIPKIIKAVRNAPSRNSRIGAESSWGRLAKVRHAASQVAASQLQDPFP